MHSGKYKMNDIWLESNQTNSISFGNDKCLQSKPYLSQNIIYFMEGMGLFLAADVWTLCIDVITPSYYRALSHEATFTGNLEATNCNACYREYFGST